MFSSFTLKRRGPSGILLCLMLAAPLAWGQSYRILVSNDDGIDSPQMAALKNALEALPGVEVSVAAPHVNNSGGSHSSIGGEPMPVQAVERAGELFGYAVHGTPADAVRWGLLALGAAQPFDLVVTGINQGANVGDVAHLSGTVGAAMEALYVGLPAVAVSQETRGADTEASARLAANLVQKLRTEGFPPRTVISINIPGGEIRGVVARAMGGSYLYTTGFREISRAGDEVTYERVRIVRQDGAPHTDTHAYQQGFITLTPLRFDWTDYEYLGEMTTWDLEALRD